MSMLPWFLAVLQVEDCSMEHPESYKRKDHLKEHSNDLLEFNKKIIRKHT